MEITTIKLAKETKNRLDSFKEYKRETYDEILEKILETLNLCRINPPAAQAKLVSISRKSLKRKKKIAKNTLKIKPKVLVSKPEETKPKA